MVYKVIVEVAYLVNPKPKDDVKMKHSFSFYRDLCDVDPHWYPFFRITFEWVGKKTNILKLKLIFSCLLETLFSVFDKFPCNLQLRMKAESAASAFIVLLYKLMLRGLLSLPKSTAPSLLNRLVKYIFKKTPVDITRMHLFKKQKTDTFFSR